MRERFEPAPEPPLKSIASVFARFMIDSIVSSTELMKQALACCGVSFTPRLNQTGLLKAMRCVTSTWLSSSREGLRILRRAEVARLVAPLADAADHASDQLLHAALALGRADVAAEILRDDDVGGELRPALRNLDVGLLEHHLTALVVDLRGAQLPFDGSERILTGFREATSDAESTRTPAGLLPALHRPQLHPSPCLTRRLHRPPRLLVVSMPVFVRPQRPLRTARLAAVRDPAHAHPPLCAACAAERTRRVTPSRPCNRRRLDQVEGERPEPLTIDDRLGPSTQRCSQCPISHWRATRPTRTTDLEDRFTNRIKAPVEPIQKSTGDERGPGTSGAPELNLGPPSRLRLASRCWPPVFETPQATSRTCLIPVSRVYSPRKGQSTGNPQNLGHPSAPTYKFLSYQGFRAGARAGGARAGAGTGLGAGLPSA